MSGPAHDPVEKEPSLKLIDWILLAVVVTVLLLVSIMLKNNLDDQNATYDQVIHAGLNAGKDSSRFIESNTAVLAFSRAKDFANMKAASTFLGFLLVFTGALYLLKVFQLSYKLKADKTPVGNVALESTSPGLVMITLGVAIIITVLVTKTEVGLDVSKPADNKAAIEKLSALTREIDSLQSVLSPQTPQGHPVKQSKKVTTGEASPLPDHFFVPATNGTIGNAQNKKTAAQLYEKLKNNPALKVNLSGSSDFAEQAGNLRRARELANELKTMLVKMGIAPERIQVTSHGESTVSAAGSDLKNGVNVVLK